MEQKENKQDLKDNAKLAKPLPDEKIVIAHDSQESEKQKESEKPIEHGFVPDPKNRLQRIEKKKLAFLDHYNTFITPAHTAQAVGISVRTFYQWCKDDARFLSAFETVDRHLTDRMIRIATSRAFRGSDNLLMFMLKSRDGRFRDKINAEINQADIERIVGTLVNALRKSIPDTCPHCKVNLNLSAKVEQMLTALSKGVAST